MTSSRKRASRDRNAEIGSRLRKLRLAHGLTLTELAPILEISVSHLSQLETGARGMSVSRLCIICEKFNVDPNMLLFSCAPTRRRL